MTNAAIRSILEGAYNDNVTTALDKNMRKENYDKMKTAYDTCMDEEVIKKAGTTPLRLLLAELEAIYPLSTPINSSISEGLTDALIWLSKNSISTLVSRWYLSCGVLSIRESLFLPPRFASHQLWITRIPLFVLSE